MSESHNSSSDDSAPRHMKSMLQETFDHSSDAQLYEYLLKNNDDDGDSLPELDASTTISSKTTTMETSYACHPVRRMTLSPLAVSASPRRRFGWTSRAAIHTTPSPIVSKSVKRPIQSDDVDDDDVSRSSLPISSLRFQNKEQEAAEKRDLQRQLRDVQEEAARQQNQVIHDYQERLQQVQQEYDNALQQHDEYTTHLLLKLQQRDEELECKQGQVEQYQRQVQEERERNYKLQQQAQPVLVYHDGASESSESVHDDDKRSESNNDSSNGSSELHAMIDECERELLQELGMNIGTHVDNHDVPIPLEIKTTHIPHNNDSSPMVACSMDLAQSLVHMLTDESISETEEDIIWSKLATMSNLLDTTDGYDEHYDYISNTSVPLTMYQRLETKCHDLEQENSKLMKETLELLSSSRTAHALQLQILIQEVKEEAQRQVRQILSGKQQDSTMIQLDERIESTLPSES